MSKSQAKYYQDLSSYERSVELANRGSRIIYLHEAQYPLLQVEVVLRERSREQMGHLELSILKLLAIGGLEVRVIAALLGFSEPRLHNLVKELHGRGLVGVQGDKFYLTELGILSVQQGFEILEVKRALLLCGITGRLMPTAVYEQPLSTVEQLGKRVYGRILIDEAQSVPTQHLDITQLKNKRDYNLPDEAVEIMSITEYEPRFLRGTLVLYETRGNRLEGEFCVDNIVVDWLKREQLVGFVEPIEWVHKKDRDAILKEICNTLQDAGCELGSSKYDNDGNPAVELVSMSDDALTLQFAQGARRPLLFFVGTLKNPTIPVFNFPKNQNLLAGHPLRITATSEALRNKIDMLRIASNALDEFYDNSGKRKGRASDYVFTKLHGAGFTEKEFTDAVHRLRLRRFSSLKTANADDLSEVGSS